ncbi:MAG TPA: mannose-6-phosphate isomerase, class I [Jatrophihabitans sp.]|jgi:mannose-6-phosphate isomerase
MTKTPSILRLDNVVRDYEWGSRTAIPELLGIEASETPAAELWMGAHPDDPSRWRDHPDVPGLDELISADPEDYLGPAAIQQFGPRLPFLLKVLAADKALSMQVHPNREQAQRGFAAENERGIPADAAERNYADANHKPELACAVTEFDAWCGFRPVDQTLRLFDALDVVELRRYRDLLAAGDGLRATFTTLLTLQGDVRRELVRAVIAGCRRLASSGREWSAEAAASVLAEQDFPDDVGAVLALLLNYVRLAPGEAIFLGAGNVHAYLRGVCVEILANSDNVLRCGLTPKHIDVPELLRVADFSPLEQPRWPSRRISEHATVFEVPVPDFQLARIDLTDWDSVGLPVVGPSIICTLEGELKVSAGTEEVALPRGQAVFVSAAAAPPRLVGSGLGFAASAHLT